MEESADYLKCMGVNNPPTADFGERKDCVFNMPDPLFPQEISHCHRVVAFTFCSLIVNMFA